MSASKKKRRKEKKLKHRVPMFRDDSKTRSQETFKAIKRLEGFFLFHSFGEDNGWKDFHKDINIFHHTKFFSITVSF